MPPQKEETKPACWWPQHITVFLVPRGRSPAAWPAKPSKTVREIAPEPARHRLILRSTGNWVYTMALEATATPPPAASACVRGRKRDGEDVSRVRLTASIGALKRALDRALDGPHQDVLPKKAATGRSNWRFDVMWRLGGNDGYSSNGRTEAARITRPRRCAWYHHHEEMGQHAAEPCGHRPRGRLRHHVIREARRTPVHPLRRLHEPAMTGKRRSPSTTRRIAHAMPAS